MSALEDIAAAVESIGTAITETVNKAHDLGASVDEAAVAAHDLGTGIAIATFSRLTAEVSQLRELLAGAETQAAQIAATAKAAAEP